MGGFQAMSSPFFQEIMELGMDDWILGVLGDHKQECFCMQHACGHLEGDVLLVIVPLPSGEPSRVLTVSGPVRGT